MVKTILLYKKYNIYAILTLEVPDSMVAAPELNKFMLEFDSGSLCINWMLFFTVATFFVTTISTVYVVFSFYKKDKELKSKAALSDYMWRLYR